MGTDRDIGKSNVPSRWRKTLSDTTVAAVQSTVIPPVSLEDPPVVLVEGSDLGARSGSSQRYKAYKASKKLYTLVVGKDIQLDRVQHLTECAMVGRLENVKVTFETLREWLKVHWKPLLDYTPLFSTLINGWYIFHFLSAKDRECIENCPWLIGRGSIVLQRWTTNFVLGDLSSSIVSPGKSTHGPSDPILGTPMPSSYRDILVAHLPVYTDHNSTKEGVTPFGSDRFKDVTIRRKRKGGRGRGVDVSSNSFSYDSYIPLSVRLAGGSGSGEQVVLDTTRNSGGATKVIGALRGLPLDTVKG